MNSEMQDIWQAKLHAWLHDPPEKPLVLMRDPGVRHDQGTARRLREAVFGCPDLPSGQVADFVKRADWWASSADRAAFPKGRRDGLYPGWQQVRFTREPVLVHPVSGQEYRIHEVAGNLEDIEVEAIKSIAQKHFESLVQRREDGSVDLRRTLLAFWRFGPELDHKGLSALWGLLPADSRTPDHTIWQHLDLTSAFCGAFAGDPGGEAALLAVTFGPVQAFIAAGRSLSDLWSGSHLISRLAWEGVKVIAAELSPDAVLFPQLRGVPLVDVWLDSEEGLGALFDRRRPEWKTRRTDANPLFVAALPNKFVAVVPASRAAELAARVEDAMRRFVQEQGEAALLKVLEEAVRADAHAPFDPQDRSLPAFAQLREQLEGFPEVHWAAVPFSLASSDANRDRADAGRLSGLLALFHDDAQAPGFLGSSAWKAFQELSRGQESNDAWFWPPRPGALYPGLYDLLERSLAAAKSVRQFPQWRQEGYRCSLTAEAEWLTTDRAQLAWSPGQRKTNGTLWTRVAKARPSWVRPGEHLGALATLKRLWPTLFTEWVGQATGLDMQRFMVSSHTLALSTSLDRWLRNPVGLDSDAARRIRESKAERSALPGRIVGENYGVEALEVAARIPAYLEATSVDDAEEYGRRVRHVRSLLGERPETYYGLLLFDGDRMGKWLSGELAPTYAQLMHPVIRQHVQTHFGGQPELSAYLQARRSPSPAFHAALSAALNTFAVEMAQPVVEKAFKGKLLYAGGDDVMALSTSDDLPDMLRLLRAAYSGALKNGGDLARALEDARIAGLGGGHALLQRGRLLRLMGDRATASAGAVIAHQMAPLGAVLRELRAAEARAKSEGGRDAFSISLVKRSGGEQHLTARWHYEECGVDTLHLLGRLRRFLAREQVSRRAVYNTLEWMGDLPDPDASGHMLEAMLAYQLQRQAGGGKEVKLEAVELAGDLVQLVLAERGRRQEEAARRRQPEDGRQPAKKGWSALDFLRGFLAVAEFLAREQRRLEVEA